MLRFFWKFCKAKDDLFRHMHDYGVTIDEEMTITSKKNEERHRSLNELILLKIEIRERKKIRKKERKEQTKSTFF